MGRFSAAAVIIVVDRREIIMDQGMGVNHLHGCHKWFYSLPGSAEQTETLLQKQRTKPLSARCHTVIHGFCQFLCKAFLFRQVSGNDTFRFPRFFFEYRFKIL